MCIKHSLAAVLALCLVAYVTSSEGLAENADDDALAGDLKLLQGKWELLHGNEGKGPPTIRSIKELDGKHSTLRRYDIATNKMIHEHSVDFTISASGGVRVFTFYPVGGDPKQGASYVYKVDADNFYDIPGLLHGKDFHNYQQTPTIWHWKRVKEKDEGAE
jgi:hypothetical protein